MTAGLTIGLMTPGWPGQNTPNGIATAVYHLALGLAATGHRPVILTSNRDGEGPPGIAVVDIPRPAWRFIDKLRSRLGDTDAIESVFARNIATVARGAIDRHRLDLLIIEETQGWAGTVQGLVPVPVVAALHGPWGLLSGNLGRQETHEDRRRRAREAKSFQAVSGLMAPSASSMSITEGLPGCAGTPRAIIPNAIDPGPAPAGRGAAGAAEVLFVGRFDRLKGADTVLEAFARLQADIPQARLTFVGPDKGLARTDGTTQTAAEALAALPGSARAQIDYTGALGWERIGPLRRRHAIALIASRYENLNYTLLEAMAAGQAIVCTRVGGPAEVLEHERTALLVPAGDPAAMAAALARLIADPALARRLGAAARARLVADFSPAAIAARTADFARAVLAARS